MRKNNSFGRSGRLKDYIDSTKEGRLSALNIVDDSYSDDILQEMEKINGRAISLGLGSMQNKKYVQGAIKQIKQHPNLLNFLGINSTSAHMLPISAFKDLLQTTSINEIYYKISYMSGENKPLSADKEYLAYIFSNQSKGNVRTVTVEGATEHVAGIIASGIKSEKNITRLSLQGLSIVDNEASHVPKTMRLRTFSNLMQSIGSNKNISCISIGCAASVDDKDAKYTKNKAKIIPALLDAIKTNDSITTLDLSNSVIYKAYENDKPKNFLENLNTNVRTLVLDECFKHSPIIRDVITIIDVLKNMESNTHITSFSVAGNNIGSDENAVEALISLVKNNHNIKHLDISNNNLNEAQLERLCIAFAESRLINIDFSDNECSVKTVNNISDMLNKNRNIKGIVLGKEDNNNLYVLTAEANDKIVEVMNAGNHGLTSVNIVEMRARETLERITNPQITHLYSMQTVIKEPEKSVEEVVSTLAEFLQKQYFKRNVEIGSLQQKLTDTLKELHSEMPLILNKRNEDLLDMLSKESGPISITKVKNRSWREYFQDCVLYVLAIFVGKDTGPLIENKGIISFNEGFDPRALKSKLKSNESDLQR